MDIAYCMHLPHMYTASCTLVLAQVVTMRDRGSSPPKKKQKETFSMQLCQKLYASLVFWNGQIGQGGQGDQGD